MNTTPRTRVAFDSTIVALQQARSSVTGDLSLEALRQKLGLQVSKATLNRVLNRQGVSLVVENAIRQALDLSPCTVEVAPCPSCGAVHAAGDCHGRPVAAVVCLAPGATIRKPAPPPARWRDYPPAELARIFVARQPYKPHAQGA